MFRICLKWIWTIQFAAMLVHANRCLSSTNNRMYNCIKHIKIHWFFSRFVVSSAHFHINSETSLCDITYSNIKCAFICTKKEKEKNQSFESELTRKSQGSVCVAFVAGTTVNYHLIFDRYWLAQALTSVQLQVCVRFSSLSIFLLWSCERVKFYRISHVMIMIWCSIYKMYILCLQEAYEANLRTITKSLSRCRIMYCIKLALACLAHWSKKS